MKDTMEVNRMETEFTAIKVGEEYTLFDIDKVRGIDSAMLFEALSDNSGYAMNIYFADMTSEEANLIASAPISVRVLRDTPTFVLPVVRFGRSPLLFEIIFDPTLYKDNRSMQLTLENNLVTIVGVDSNTNIVKALRLVSIPKRLREIWLTSWTKALEMNDFSRKYNMWVSDISRRYSPEKLWDMSVYVGKFGDK